MGTIGVSLCGDGVDVREGAARCDRSSGVRGVLKLARLVLWKHLNVYSPYTNAVVLRECPFARIGEAPLAQWYKMYLSSVIVYIIAESVLYDYTQRITVCARASCRDHSQRRTPCCTATNSYNAKLCNFKTAKQNILAYSVR